MFMSTTTWNRGQYAIASSARGEDWNLDPTGNWADYVYETAGTSDLEQSRPHNEANEIDGVTERQNDVAWITPEHDPAGNMTTVPKPSSLANGLTCKYDAWNRLVEVTDGQTVVGRYTYDGLNRRIVRAYDSQSPSEPNGVDQYVHYFYNNKWQILETRDTASSAAQAETLQPKYQYVWSLRYIDAPVLRDENTDTDGLCDDARIYFLNDANMNVIALVQPNGTVLERYHYDPYGHVTIHDGTWANTRTASLYNNPHLYTGRELDRETGLYQYRNRYYSAELGRFVSRDPMAYDAGDPNVYGYVGNMPLTVVDPFGEDAVVVNQIEEGMINDWLAKGTLYHDKYNTREYITTLAGSNCDCSCPSQKDKKVCTTVSLESGTKLTKNVSVTASGNSAVGIVVWGKKVVWQKLGKVPLWSTMEPWTFPLCMNIPACKEKSAKVYRRVEHHGVHGSVYLWEGAIVGGWPGSGSVGSSWDYRGSVKVSGDWEVYTKDVSMVVKEKDCP